MGENPAAQKLRVYLERIERLQEERATIADDIAEVFKELTDEGFDKEATKVVLKIRKNAEALTVWQERSVTVDLYLSSLGMIPERIEVRAPARTREIIEHFPISPSQAAVVTDENLREPVAAASGQIVREDGDAPHEASDGGSFPDTEFEPPAFLVKAVKPLRPLCLNPSECAGYGTHTCHRCLTAAGQKDVAA